MNESSPEPRPKSWLQRQSKPRVIGFTLAWVLYGAAVCALVELGDIQTTYRGLFILNALTTLLALAAVFLRWDTP